MGRSATHTLLRLAVVGAGLGPMLCFGLGLSELQIESRLNQPLRARIEVLDVTDEEWSRIQIRLTRQSAPDTPALQPTILESLTVRALQDVHHRRFVEVRSIAPLSDPLFDLPVEIAGPNGRVIRNYAVLLDPPGLGEDLPQNLADTKAPQAGVTDAALKASPADAALASRSAAAGEPPAAVDPLRGPTRSNTSLPASNSTSHARQRKGGHRARGADPEQGHSGNPAPADNRGTADRSPSGTARHTIISGHKGGPEDVSPNDRAQPELLKQLDALQQTLTGMQQTISAQNAQIAELTAKVARAESQAPRATRADFRTAASSGSVSTDRDAGEADVAADEAVSPRPYFWLTVVLGGTTFVTIVSALLMKWRATRTGRKLVANGAADQRGRDQRRSSESARSSEHPGTSAQQAGADRQAPQGASTDTEYANGGATRGKGRSLTTPAAQQKQMEADGRVEISWDKELWNKPEWLRLFGEQPALSAGQTAAAERGPDTPGFEAQAEIHTSAAPHSQQSQVAPAEATSQTAYSGTELGDLTESMAEQFFGEDTTKLAEVYAAAIREHAGDIRLGRDLAGAVECQDSAALSETVSVSDITRLVEVEATELLQPDPAQLSETALLPEPERTPGAYGAAETARLSETQAAELLAADLSDLTHLTDLTEAAEAEAKVETAKLSETNTTQLIEASGARRPDEDTHVLDQQMRPDRPRMRRRRAGRR